MIVAPGLSMAVGSFLQAAYRWVWPAGLVLLASGMAAYFGIGVWFMFGYIGYKSTLPLVYVYMGLVTVTPAISLANAIAEMVLRFSDKRAAQIVGREP